MTQLLSKKAVFGLGDTIVREIALYQLSQTCGINGEIRSFWNMKLNITFLGFIAGLVFSTGAYAGNCIGEICVGGLVIDSSDRIGTVEMIGSETVTYSVPGYNPLVASASQLAPEQAGKGGVSRGVTVMDASERIGTVSRFFANGKVQYNVPGYNPLIDLVGTLSPQVAEYPGHKDVSAKSVVIDSSERVGTVEMVFGNGKVQYNVDGYNPLITGIASLSPEVKSIDSLKPRVTIIDAGNRIGTVRNLFANRKVIYLVSGYNPLFAEAKTLNIRVEKIGALTPGTTIIDSSDRVGSVAQLFANGKAQYNVPGYNPLIDMVGSLAHLVAEYSGRNDIHAKATIIDSSDRIGTVELVFANGKVQYNVPGYNPLLDMIGTLAASVPSFQGYEDISAGTTVVDSSNRIGKVQLIFANAKTQYNVPGYNPLLAIIGSLSPEVETNPNFNKDSYYANSDFSVGKANRFFKNGQVELLNDSGSSFVSKLLFAEVNHINGYMSGTPVVTPSEIAGTATRVFANGAVEYSYTLAKSKFNHTERKAFGSGKVMGFDPKQTKEDEVSWIRSLATHLAESDGNFFFGSSDKILADQIGYPALKLQLFARLNGEPKLVQNSALRAKVSAFLNADAGGTSPVPNPGSPAPRQRSGRRGD
ncbi:MAG: hypothetical protein HY074_19790 [Deltaproteobacteria bacterium]|nr:hypothetical protein [Deltaproteobacteria bacterium]